MLGSKIDQKSKPHRRKLHFSPGAIREFRLFSMLVRTAARISSDCQHFCNRRYDFCPPSSWVPPESPVYRLQITGPTAPGAIGGGIGPRELSPFQGERFHWMVPRVETLGSVLEPLWGNKPSQTFLICAAFGNGQTRWDQRPQLYAIHHG